MDPNTLTGAEGEAVAMEVEEGGGEKEEEGGGRMRLHRRTFRIRRMSTIMFRRTPKELQ